MTITNMQPLHQYQNGNCSVCIFPDGTKIRDWEGVARPEFPESIDVKCTDWCDAGCAWCFPAGTLISTPTGEIPIEDIKTGDVVIGFNEKTETFQCQNVQRIFQRNISSKLIEIQGENEEILRLTPEHEVFVFEKGWVLAKDLSIDDEILKYK